VSVLDWSHRQRYMVKQDHGTRPCFPNLRQRDHHHGWQRIPAIATGASLTLDCFHGLYAGLHERMVGGYLIRRNVDGGDHVGLNPATGVVDVDPFIPGVHYRLHDRADPRLDRLIAVVRRETDVHGSHGKSGNYALVITCRPQYKR
jgi:hypothetical protein